MPKNTDITIDEIRVESEPLTFRAPLKFGGRIVEHYTVVNVHARVHNEADAEAVGFGSMPIGHIWAWPTTLDPAVTQEAMWRLSLSVGSAAQALDASGHALELGWLLVQRLDELSTIIQREMELPEDIPRLAQLVAASPIDAAIHDAYGKVNRINIYNALGREYCNSDLSTYLNDEFRGEYLDRYTMRAPKNRMPLYHLVGALDPLADADLSHRIGDGLPETLGEWIAFNGLTHLKIKLAGDQLDWDIDRVVSIDRVASEAQKARGCRVWHYSLDFNEKCGSVDYVLEFLHRVRAQAPDGWKRIQYIEQPTHRDLKRPGAVDIHEAARIKPVVIDESLLDFESLLRARELGYTGVALKACKGQTESLLAAAAAQKYNMFLCVQDLTCPGASFLQSAELAARIPGVAAIEGNGRQYCPAGNAAWAGRFPSMFHITDGTLETSCLIREGLGH